MQYTLTAKQIETIDLYMRHPAATALVTPQQDGAIVVAILDDQGTNLDTITIEPSGKTHHDEQLAQATARVDETLLRESPLRNWL